MTVTTVRESLTPDVSDAEIGAFAEREDWIVFTNDDDFHHPSPSHGLVVYSQREDPPPSDVVDAVIAIDRAYVSPIEILEFVPDGWVEEKPRTVTRYRW